jgi:hypothetical protein
MSSRTFVRIAMLLGALALLVPFVASAGNYGKGGYGKKAHKLVRTQDAAKRILLATDSAGNLLSFRGSAPEAARSRPITGLPSGVVLKGIDFRPATCTRSVPTRSSTASIPGRRSPSPKGPRSRR